MNRLYHWNAKRSGAGITITARDRLGEVVKIRNVEAVFAKDGSVLARDASGQHYELVPTLLPVPA